VSAGNLRAVLTADQELGAGNVLLRLAEHGADMDMPRVTFDTEVDAIAAWTPLSLRTLTERVAARAEWYRRHGIGRRDPVAVYVTSAADVFLNFFALSWLGAIPALMNGNMPAEIAAEYIRRLRAAGVIIDADHAALAEHDLGAPIIGDAAETGTGDPSRAPAHKGCSASRDWLIARPINPPVGKALVARAMGAAAGAPASPGSGGKNTSADSAIKAGI